MTIKAHEVHQFLKHRYPKAEVFVLDEFYELPSRAEVETLYDKFQRALKWHNLLKWLPNVFDCDNFAWNFKGASNAHRAAKGERKEFPIGFVCYKDNRLGPHAINNAIWRESDYNLIREIEPQSGGGIMNLSKEERESAWLVIV